MRKKYRVALLSAGMITNAAHIPAYQQFPEAFELCGICDLRLQAAQETADRYHIPGVYTNFEQMLAEIKPDIVSICTPNAFHVEQTLTALGYGAHVICEKPLALTYADAVRVFAAAEAAGKYVIPSQSGRFSKDTFTARDIVKNGALGAVYYGDITCVRRRGIPTWGTFHMKEHSGGGAFCDLGVHMFDFFLWATGNPRLLSVSGSTATKIAKQPTQLLTSLTASGAPKGVTAPRAYDYREFNTEEFASGFARFEGGMTVNFKIAWALNHPDEYHISLIGDRGGLSLPDMTLYGSLGQYQSDMHPVVPDSPLYNEDFYGHKLLFGQILLALDGEAPPPITPQEALNVVAVIDGFYRSAAAGREVLMEEIAEKS